MNKIEVVRDGELKKGDPTMGIIREMAFDDKGALFARSRIPGGNKSEWHTHGSRDLYGFIVQGRFIFYFGKGGKSSVEVRAGDFFHIPTGLIHRDENPDSTETVILNIQIGEGPVKLVPTGGPESA
jgi:mannose-6-phosphate isomerase-like protein (cupin superfamily)